jgi:RecG-like helicase
VEGDEVTILAEVLSSTNRPLRGRKGSIFEVVVTDGTDKLSLTFFNQAWREKELKAGRQGLFAGKVGVFNGKKQLAHPDYESIYLFIQPARRCHRGRFLNVLRWQLIHSMKWKISCPNTYEAALAIPLCTRD